jgi:hypothetical protein
MIVALMARKVVYGMASLAPSILYVSAFCGIGRAIEHRPSRLLAPQLACPAGAERHQRSSTRTWAHNSPYSRPTQRGGRLKILSRRHGVNSQPALTVVPRDVLPPDEESSSAERTSERPSRAPRSWLSVRRDARDCQVEAGGACTGLGHDAGGGNAAVVFQRLARSHRFQRMNVVLRQRSRSRARHIRIRYIGPDPGAPIDPASPREGSRIPDLAGVQDVHHADLMLRPVIAADIQRPARPGAVSATLIWGNYSGRWRGLVAPSALAG